MNRITLIMLSLAVNVLSVVNVALMVGVFVYYKKKRGIILAFLLLSLTLLITALLAVMVI